MAAPSPEFAQVVAEHRERLNRLVDQRGAASMKRLYDEAQAELVARLGALSGPAKQTMTAHQMRVMLGQVKLGQAQIAHRMAGGLGEASREAQTEALRGLTSSVRRLERRFGGAAAPLPIEEAARFQGIIDARRPSLLNAHRSSMNRYGAFVVGRMQDELSKSLMTGENNEQAIDRIAAVGDTEWWRAERIVRTELAWSANASHADGIQVAAQELPGLMSRWSEHVDDASYAPLDDRVAVDSIAMHGQIAPAGGLFVMPPTAPAADSAGRTEVPAALVGRSWAHPPNRPNDRAVLTPWRAEWGTPGWRWDGSRRVPVEAQKQAERVAEVGKEPTQPKPEPVQPQKPVEMPAPPTRAAPAQAPLPYSADWPGGVEREADGYVYREHDKSGARTLHRADGEEIASLLPKAQDQSAFSQATNLSGIPENMERLLKLHGALELSQKRLLISAVERTPDEEDVWSGLHGQGLVEALRHPTATRGYVWRWRLPGVSGIDHDVTNGIAVPQGTSATGVASLHDLDPLLPKAEQKRVRDVMLEHLSSRYGVASRDVAKPGGVKVEVLSRSDVGGFHNWNGAIEFGPAFVVNLRSYAARLATGSTDASIAELRGAHYTLHEIVHGLTPMETGAYHGEGAFIEEVTVESLTRRAMRDMDPNANVTSGLLRGVGGYTADIDQALAIIKSKAQVDDAGALAIMEEAAIAMRQPGIGNTTTPAELLMLFTKSLPSRVTATQREEIRIAIHQHVATGSITVEAAKKGVTGVGPSELEQWVQKLLATARKAPKGLRDDRRMMIDHVMRQMGEADEAKFAMRLADAMTAGHLTPDQAMRLMP